MSTYRHVRLVPAGLLARRGVLRVLALVLVLGQVARGVDPLLRPSVVLEVLEFVTRMQNCSIPIVSLCMLYMRQLYLPIAIRYSSESSDFL